MGGAVVGNHRSPPPPYTSAVGQQPGRLCFGWRPRVSAVGYPDAPRSEIWIQIGRFPSGSAHWEAHERVFGPSEVLWGVANRLSGRVRESARLHAAAEGLVAVGQVRGRAQPLLVVAPRAMVLPDV